MITFDQILPIIIDILKSYQDNDLNAIGSFLINRDLNGRIRLIAPESVEKNDSILQTIQLISEDICTRLKNHAYTEQAILFVPNIESVIGNALNFPIVGFEQIIFVDRLATESNWANIEPETQNAPRVVFFSIKGGVGRSTALAASAWALAQAGKKVLALDLDLESPGLSSALLPKERYPKYGIVDWLVEDLIDNGEAVINDLVATSQLSYDGEIFVVPAHGIDAGEYISKLGRVWMPKVDSSGSRQNWSQRLNRLINQLEQYYQPDIIFLDSRSGIDEVASSCVTDIGANSILLFAIDGEQTWSGYRILFEHWHRSNVVQQIRERLQVVGALIPEDDRHIEYFDNLREHSADLFLELLYDEIPAGQVGEDLWSFDIHDPTSPHYPLAIHWNQGFSAIQSIHSRLNEIDSTRVMSIFGELVTSLENTLKSG